MLSMPQGDERLLRNVADVGSLDNSDPRTTSTTLTPTTRDVAANLIGRGSAHSTETTDRISIVRRAVRLAALGAASGGVPRCRGPSPTPALPRGPNETIAEALWSMMLNGGLAPGQQLPTVAETYNQSCGRNRSQRTVGPQSKGELLASHEVGAPRLPKQPE